jgi:hypothetical protein
MNLQVAQKAGIFSASRMTVTLKKESASWNSLRLQRNRLDVSMKTVSLYFFHFSCYYVQLQGASLWDENVIEQSDETECKVAVQFREFLSKSSYYKR